MYLYLLVCCCLLMIFLVFYIFYCSLHISTCRAGLSSGRWATHTSTQCVWSVLCGWRCHIPNWKLHLWWTRTRYVTPVRELLAYYTPIYLKYTMLWCSQNNCFVLSLFLSWCLHNKILALYRCFHLLLSSWHRLWHTIYTPIYLKYTMLWYYCFYAFLFCVLMLLQNFFVV